MSAVSSHRKLNGKGSIYKRSDSEWCAQIQIQGAPKPTCFYATKYRAVKKKLDNYIALIQSGKDTVKSISITQYINAWLTTVKINDLKPSSYDRLERTINSIIIPAVGSFDFYRITSQQIQTKLINPLKKKYSYSSIKKVYEALNSCYKYALSSPNCPRKDNPMNTVTIPSEKQFNISEIYWLNDNEIHKFKEECIARYATGSYRHSLGYGMILILETGIRLGEAIAIKWKDVDIINKRLRIKHNAITVKNRSKTAQKKHMLLNQDFMKSKSSRRIIPLNKTAVDALMHIKEIRYFGVDSFVFSTKEGGQVTAQNLERQFKAIIGRAGIQDCGIHTLRHTFASMLFKKKTDIKTISKLLGHSNVSITYNIYIHIIEELEVEAVGTIADI